VNSQQFLLLNIAILTIFILWFLAGRRSSQKKPTSLDMKRGNRTEGGVLQKAEGKAVSGAGSSGRYSHPKYQKFLDEATDPGIRGPKELNILFNYNGHTWDAYEVLGLPAGTGLVEVTKAYQALLKTADPDSHEFLETAFKSILAKK
jgi:hypothetical protein